MINKRLAIIGVGPRGLYAAENFITQLSLAQDQTTVELLLFEETGDFGNGQVYSTDQVKSNWINITERILTLPKRDEVVYNGISIPSFSCYHQWANLNFDKIGSSEPDTYPPRAKIGEYLKQRFTSFITPLLLHKIAFLYQQKVTNIQLSNNAKVSITTLSKTYTNVDEVLLAIGHQPTYVTPQLVKWHSNFKNNSNVKLFLDPYPVKNYIDVTNTTNKTTVGVRGLGLAMLDVMRGVLAKQGFFKIIDEATKKSEFISSTRLQTIIVPFSLDGLPPVPKPLNKNIDDLYKPSDEQIYNFEKEIGNQTAQSNAKGVDFLVSAIVPIVARIYTSLPHTLETKNYTFKQVEEAAFKWVTNQNYKHSLILPTATPIVALLNSYIGMATAKSAVSLDFCIGQVWRHCQPSIYKQLSYNNCSNTVFEKIIKLDEEIKRYSYGPPVESIQQMLALVKAGILNLDFVKNPKIELSINGWVLSTGNKSIELNVMINSVLDAPKITAVKSDLVKSLLHNESIKIVSDNLGVQTTKDGYLIEKDTKNKLPIALLGRLAKGTVIGVDAILECFGDRPTEWAKAAVKGK
ncbi:FAD/NAD(P)-binding protein [Cellulophaga omnivescoria]|uniref:FAD/NAD(P)-binding protein n=1 Tax=Cellulophaga omnivescoria TaxID=1888890 RepID=UPI0022F0EA33|nr:FAD/NAD(P)-binding protein [Cellulophaga omnivescoria]WBU88428.1 FAD/NAD(P)-binding protein [Cellulophaga omnivescoria]